MSGKLHDCLKRVDCMTGQDTRVCARAHVSMRTCVCGCNFVLVETNIDCI